MCSADFWIGAKAVHGRKIFFSTNNVERIGHSHARNKNKQVLDQQLTLNAKMNSTQTIDLDVKSKTTKLLEENIRENICELGKAKSYVTLKAYSTRNKWIN